jgi:hypothetical protein
MTAKGSPSFVQRRLPYIEGAARKGCRFGLFAGADLVRQKCGRINSAAAAYGLQIA